MTEDNAECGLSEKQQRLLGCVLDLIIPASADGHFPAAGQLGLCRYVCEHAAESLALVVEGLSLLEHIADRHGAAGFAEISPKDATVLLGELDAEQPAFLATLIFHTYTGYYQDPQVIAALGLRPGPPFPGGYEVAASDLSILDGVRQRSKLYRE